MTGHDIIQKVTALDLPSGAFIVFGSGTLALLGIRETQDIDLLISEELYDRLLARGWKPVDKPGDDHCLVHGVFDAHTNWHIGDYDPTLADLLKTAITVDGIPFAALEEVRNWKAVLGRPKDVQDLALINEYIQAKTRN